MKPLDPTWAPVFSSAIVGVTSVFGLWLVQWKTSQREHAAKEKEAKQTRADRWDDFRMKTLLDLQDTLHRMVLVPSRKLAANPGESDLTLMTDMRDTRFQASVLCSRLRDEQLGKLVQRLGIISTGFLVEATRDHQTDMQSTFDEVNDRIGELLATLRPDHP